MIDGAVTIWALLQAEVTIYVVAQTIPLLRVLFLSDSSRDSKPRGSTGGRTSPNRSDKEKHPAAGTDSVQEVRPSIELVQLPTGRIVPADSEEGREFRASTSRVASPETPGAGRETPASAISAPRPREEQGRAGVPQLDDEVHRIWADMGLSRRAWSKSPSPPPEDCLRQRSLNASGRA